MSQADAMEAVARLIAAYRQDIKQESAVIYAEKLADIPAELLDAAVDRLINSQKFFPAISEIRHAAARIAGLLPVTQAEALAIVRRADVSRPVYRRDGSYAYTEREWDWPDDLDELTLDLIRDTLQLVGEPIDGEGKALFGWDTGFGKTYEVQAESVTREALANLSHAQLPAHKPKLLLVGRAQEVGR